MSSWDDPPDYPVNSDLVRRLKAALDAKDEGTLRELMCAEVEPVDAVIELANDDWMKDPSAQLPPGALLGNQDEVDAGRVGRAWSRGQTTGEARVCAWTSESYLCRYQPK